MLSRFVPIVGVCFLAACAVDPRKRCGELVPDTWEYMGPDAELDAQFASSLPPVPYTTNENKAVRSVRHLWYRSGNSALAACTLGRYARNNCSVKSTEFVLEEHQWKKSREDGVLCNVLAGAGK